MFANAMPLSPWLVPVDESLAAVSQETLQQGLFFTSSADLQELTDHLRSLLTAGLDGEEVVFRFYDPKVLLPMLMVMDESDLNALFGNIKELIAFHTETDQLQTWSSTRVTPFELQPAPWWPMKEAHLKPLYSTQTHAVILEKRFWEVLPESMEALDHPWRPSNRHWFRLNRKDLTQNKGTGSVEHAGSTYSGVDGGSMPRFSLI